MTPSSSSPFAAQSSSAAQAAQSVVRHGRVLSRPPNRTARVESESFAFGAMPVTLPAGDPVPHEATPGELLAVAHAMFMAAAVAEELSLAGSPANEIVVEADCTYEGPFPDRALTHLEFHVTGRVPGLDAAGFRDAVESGRRRSLLATGARDDLPCELQVTLGDV